MKSKGVCSIVLAWLKGNRLTAFAGAGRGRSTAWPLALIALAAIVLRFLAISYRQTYLG